MKTLLLAGLCLIGAMVASGAGAQEATKVRMGTEGASPPFNFIDKNSKLAGFDIEIGNALCAAAKLECTWVTQDWDGIVAGLQAAKYDTIVASMSITPERLEAVDFTEPYYREAGVLVAAKGTPFKGTLRDTVAGKIIGAQTGTAHDTYARATFGDVAEIKSYDTAEQAHLDLTAGRIDFFTDGIIAVTGGFLATELGKGYAVVGEPFMDPGIHGLGAGIAVRKGDDKLRKTLNAALRQIRIDGTYQAISDKYFGVDVYRR